MRDPTGVPGYLAPVRQALTQTILFGGAPRPFAILNGTLAMMVAFSGALAAGLVLGLAGHLGGVFLARADAQALDVLARGMRLPARFEI